MPSTGTIVTTNHFSPMHKMQCIALKEARHRMFERPANNGAKHQKHLCQRMPQTCGAPGFFIVTAQKFAAGKFFQ
jgi:hypothetical protein